ncbi:discoidin domain-containing protein, partial [Paenibacillus sp. 598K]|uniref:discoidin domain-containing protein n=1 Tax=Paenibacillus sp. 598K TaxID=1117987 RepID=UPI0011CF15ED
MNRIQRMRAMTCLLICVLLTGLLPQTGARLSASGEVNLALGKAVTSSSSYENPAEGWARVHLTDGSKTGPYASGSTANGWTTMPSSSQPAPGSPAWVKVDLGAAHWTDQIVLWPRSDGGTNYTGVGFPVDFRILVSIDDQSWTEVGSWSGYPAPTNGAALTHAISAVQARYVMVEATALSRDNHQAYVMQLRELEVRQAASTLSDADAVAADHAELQLPYPQP